MVYSQAESGGVTGRPPAHPRSARVESLFGRWAPPPETLGAVLELWPDVAAGLPRPFLREAAELDLAYWRWRREPFPPRRALVERWGWSDNAVRGLLAAWRGGA